MLKPVNVISSSALPDGVCPLRLLCTGCPPIDVAVAVDVSGLLLLMLLLEDPSRPSELSRPCKPGEKLKSEGEPFEAGFDVSSSCGLSSSSKPSRNSIVILLPNPRDGWLQTACLESRSPTVFDA